MLPALALVASAHATDLPAWAPLPAGVTAQAPQYYEYDLAEINYPDASGAVQHLKPAGHHWTTHVAGLGGDALFNAWKPVLQGGGWTILRAQGTLVARRAVDGTTAWLVSTGADLNLLEETPLPALKLAPPAAAPQPWAKDQLPEYVAALPQSTLAGWETKDQLVETTPSEFIGKPLLKLRFTIPAGSAVEEQEVYTAALTTAGWTVVRAGGTVIGHYARSGRDVWLKMTPMNREYTIEIGDPGLAAASSALRQQLASQGHVAPYGIYFDLDKSTLKPESEATLQQVLSMLNADSRMTLEVQGHTDATGTADHNQPLSQARAEAVVGWLVQHGVAAARLKSAGYAATRPVADNGTAQGRALNRRVELAKTGG